MDLNYVGHLGQYDFQHFPRGQCKLNNGVCNTCMELNLNAFSVPSVIWCCVFCSSVFIFCSRRIFLVWETISQFNELNVMIFWGCFLVLLKTLFVSFWLWGWVLFAFVLRHLVSTEGYVLFHWHTYGSWKHIFFVLTGLTLKLMSFWLITSNDI